MSITKIDKFVGQWTWNVVLCNEVKLENRTTESWEKYDRDITIILLKRINQLDQTKVSNFDYWGVM